ncbi:MAG: hypothetical protein HRU76_09180 [Phycisphaeraceae bacterium]|nr:hypothetical protein [Phycisphaerales bacterium]QOJ17743.1 MAG: hypothetical protein HRU76_09180 [Phycisphaeraceae bacterium]
MNRHVCRAFIAAIAFSAAFVWNASGGIVHFVNPAPGEPGHFNWHWQQRFDPPSWEHWLNITKPSTDQQESRTGNSVGQHFAGGGDMFNATSEAAWIASYSDLVVTRALELDDDVSASFFRDGAEHSGDFKGWESDFPRGVVRYMGVLTQSGNHGWIAVIRAGEGHHRYSFLALAWAYETVPGKPILAGQVPGAGGLALLLPAMFLTRRRRHPAR